jgi:hypothetical protein
MDKLKVLQLLVKHARPEILKEYRRDSCIASSGVGLDVLDHFGILGEPLAVKVMIWNPAFVKRIEAGHPFPKDRAELDVWVKEDGAWNVGLGLGGDPEPMKWPGHLVIIGERRYLLDLSLDQASRPQHNINLDVLGAEITDDFLSGKEPRIVEIGGSIIRFIAWPDNLGYTNSPDWMFRTRRNRIVQRVIRSIEEELG